MVDKESLKKDSEDEVQLVIFSLGSEEFAAEITQVREIISIDKITRVPSAPKFIFGVINLRGKLVTVVDLHERLGFQRTQPLEKSKIIVSDIKGGVLGMMVDQVVEVSRVLESQIEPPPPMSAGKIDSKYILGIAKMKDRLIVILDLENVLIDEEVGIVGPEEQEE
ncbi:MAG: chemotaxis protein CheW [Thermoplasmata archaeon]